MDFARDRLARFDGMARARELDAAGVDRDRRDIGVMYGSLLKVRKGWYADPDLPETVREAWRIGGRVACVSALRLLGVDDLAGGESEESLHVELPRGASRLRLSSPGVTIVRHWTRHPAGENRFVVPLEIARRQAGRCRASGRR